MRVSRAMDMRTARYEDHNQDIQPAGGSQGDPLPIVMPNHSLPGPNQAEAG
jgi:hypothetical protein